MIYCFSVFDGVYLSNAMLQYNIFGQKINKLPLRSFYCIMYSLLCLVFFFSSHFHFFQVSFPFLFGWCCLFPFPLVGNTKHHNHIQKWNDNRIIAKMRSENVDHIVTTYTLQTTHRKSGEFIWWFYWLLNIHKLKP